MVKLFRDALGYDYLGNWTDREGTHLVERHHNERFTTLMDQHLRNGACGRRN